MSGHLKVRSKPGRGTLFVLDLPMDVSGEITRERDSHVEALDRLYGARILLAEDNVVNQQVVQALLSGFGCQIDVAENGQEAVDLWSAHTYDLIMMDMQMPEIDGLDATRQIRQLPDHHATPILAMTANVFAEDKARCLRAGMDDFLTKPAKPDVLYATLLKWLGQRRD